MRKSLLVGVMCLFVWMGMAQVRGDQVRVVVSPDRADWTYEVGESCQFTVRVMRDQLPIEEAVVDYELGPEMYPVEKRQQVPLKGGKLVLKGSMKEPGFLKCKVKAYVNGRTYEGLANAAYEPERLRPLATMPADFTQFWKESIDAAREVPLESTMRLLPERCTETVNAYEVSFQNERPGSRMYGILTMPRKPGSYPALLRVPGAGVRPYTGDTWVASKGAIVLEIGVHGIPVTMPQEVYDRLQGGALNGYWAFNLNDRYTNYYRRVITGVIRAIDFIDTLPEYDHERLGITGSSQGGALSIIGAALDSRITFYAAIHPALCDHAAFLKGRAGGWPHYFYNKENPDPRMVENAAYYDAANFATLLKVPGWFSFGFNDEVCPPTSTYSTYNIVTAEKELHPYRETGHYWYQEQYDEWNAWLLKMLGLAQ